MPKKWLPIKRKVFETYMKTLKETVERFSQIETEIIANNMPQVLMTWTDAHTKALSKLAACSRAVVDEIDDQVIHFKEGSPCRIEQTQEKNADDDASSSLPPTKQPATAAPEDTKPPVKKKGLK